MAFEFKLPDIGEGVVEGEIVKWLVQPGDPVDADQPMVEVMTDKATVVIPSPTRGVVKETRGAEGDIVEVHSVIVVIDEDAEAGASPTSEIHPPSSSSAAVRSPVAPVSTPAAELRAVPSPVASIAPAVAVAPSPPLPPAGGKVLAAPATRRLARELGVDISVLSGSGPAGRVTSDDVRAAVQPRAGSSVPAAPVPVAPVPVAPVPAAVVARAPVAVPAQARAPDVSVADEVIPVRGLRRRIWEKMAQSVFTAAHFTFVEECDMTELVKVRARFNTRLREGEPKLNFLPFIAKAALSSLKKFPQLNGQVDDDAMQFIQRSEYHLGIAVASKRGLVVPVVRHADRRSVLEFEQEVRRLADSVRDGSLKTEDLGGSTFTITSLGKDGGIFATPIINYPEVAILGVHKISKKPAVVDDEIQIRHMMNLSLSFDHRLIDGHIGAAFTCALVRLLEDPDRLMMEMA